MKSLFVKLLGIPLAAFVLFCAEILRRTAAEGPSLLQPSPHAFGYYGVIIIIAYLVFRLAKFWHKHAFPATQTEDE